VKFEPLLVVAPRVFLQLFNHIDCKIEDIPGVALAGPSGGRYWPMAAKDSREVSESEAASVLRQNMVLGPEYNIGFTSTPSYGSHWSMTVQLDAQGEVMGIIPLPHLGLAEKTAFQDPSNPASRAF